MKLTIILNYKNEKNKMLAAKIIDFLNDYPVELFLPADKPGFSPEDCQNKDFSDVEVALVLGGDGTILAASRQIAGFGVAILGINMGKVGFLSEVEEKNLFSSLIELINGNYFIEERMALEGTVLRDGISVFKAVALNEFYLNNFYFSRTIDFEVSLMNEYITDYRADGMIISTPTGSSAYSFSAGGPLVMPQMELILLTPICSHSVFSRPLIIPVDETVKIIYNSDTDNACLAADGQVYFTLKNGDSIYFRALPKRVRLLHFSKSLFFDRVRRKIYKEE